VKSFSQLHIGTSLLTLLRGDITLQDTEAIVNAANSTLMGGGGVDGAIHRAGGPEILEECQAIRTQRGNLPPGEAVITTAGRLSAKNVIHTVGPIWRGGTHGEDILLANAYRNSLTQALQNHLTTISFPSISTGVYGFPVDRASRIALTTVKQFVQAHPSIREVRFVVFDEHAERTYAALFNETNASPPAKDS
jgi:O-acetyl-ADP-ribose deacetylase (regulator of RNase III)